MPKVRTRPRLWGQIALSLGLTFLALLVLNAGVAWLVISQVQTSARVALAEQIATTMGIELASVHATAGPSAYREVLSRFSSLDLTLEELWVVSPRMEPLAVVTGSPPHTPDKALREALFGRSPHVGIEGRFTSSAQVVVTRPIPDQGPPVAALRIAIPITGLGLEGSRWGFLLFYVGFTACVVGLAGALLFRARLVRPVQVLMEGTERIASGDFQHRVELDAALELMELTEALNRMASSLAEYQASTRDQVKRLELANTALARAQDDLVRSARLASVGRLAAGIAHEVGNPLAAVLGYLDLLRDLGDDPTLSKDLVERTLKEVERIHRILRDLLDFARPGEGIRQALPVRRAVEEAASTLRYQPAFREVELDLSLPEDLPPVVAEADKLHQILVNLMLNAGDAMGGRGHLRVQARVVESSLELTLHDSGPGLSPDALAHLFEPFFTTKAIGQGTGLGLATSLSLAERLGGGLVGRNAPGGGAEFRLSLPLADSAAGNTG